MLLPQDDNALAKREATDDLHKAIKSALAPSNTLHFTHHGQLMKIAPRADVVPFRKAAPSPGRQAPSVPAPHPGQVPPLPAAARIPAVEFLQNMARSRPASLGTQLQNAIRRKL
ncbi:MAG: hypothetical protein ABI645_00470 [Pseudomonadota bacterium]